MAGHLVSGQGTGDLRTGIIGNGNYRQRRRGARSRVIVVVPAKACGGERRSLRGCDYRQRRGAVRSGVIVVVSA